MLPSQRLMPGVLEPAFLREKAALLEADALARLWARDPGLWGADEIHSRLIQNRLGWLQLIERMRPEVPRLVEFVAATRQDGLRDVLFLGMGACSRTAELLAATFPPSTGQEFRVLGNLDAAAMHAIESEFDLRRTLVVIASKSGATVETLSQFMLFLNRVKQLGVAAPARQFAVVTDEGSYLYRLANEYKVRAAFLNPPDVWGGYSALSFFGLLPAALLGLDLSALLDGAEEMRGACGPSADPENNPALALGALLGAGAMEGRDKLVLLGSPSRAPVCRWIEQLVAESTCKQGIGVVPVLEELPLASEAFLPHSMVAIVRRPGETDAAFDRAGSHLLDHGVPLIDISLDTVSCLGAELFKWQVAVVLACAILEVDPFDDTDARESREAKSLLLDSLRSDGNLAEPAARLEESGIELYVEGSTRRGISSLNLSEALRTFLELRPADGYVALLLFVDKFEVHRESLEGIRRRLAAALGVPVLLSSGPCYLYSFGQTYRGGPGNGLYLMITAPTPMDLLVPGENFKFAQMHRAQALAELESLIRLGKPVMRLHLTRGPEEGLRQLDATLQLSLSRLRLAGE